MRTRETTCCFTGHRPGKLPWGYDETDPRCLDLKRRLAGAVEAAYEEGIRHFTCGMALGCDQYFCEAVLALRERRPGVVLEAAIPCPAQAKRWSVQQRERYNRLVEACDLETVISEAYGPGCMQRRDRYMVDHASLLIAAFDGTSGGTRYTLEYAMSRRISIVDLPLVLP